MAPNAWKVVLSNIYCEHLDFALEDYPEGSLSQSYKERLAAGFADKCMDLHRVHEAVDFAVECVAGYAVSDVKAVLGTPPESESQPPTEADAAKTLDEDCGGEGLKFVLIHREFDSEGRLEHEAYVEDLDGDGNMTITRKEEGAASWWDDKAALDRAEKLRKALPANETITVRRIQ